MRARLLLSLLALMFVVPAAAAQEEGERVRVVDLTGRTWSGRVAAAHDTAIVIAERSGPRILARDSLARLEVRVPRSRAEGTLRYAALGTASGAVSGAAIWGAVTALSDCFPGRIDEDGTCLSAGEAALIGAMVGAPLGAVSGAALGFFFPGERWAPAPIRARVVITPAGRAAVGVSVEF